MYLVSYEADDYYSSHIETLYGGGTSTSCSSKLDEIQSTVAYSPEIASMQVNSLYESNENILKSAISVGIKLALNVKTRILNLFYSVQRAVSNFYSNVKLYISSRLRFWSRTTLVSGSQNDSISNSVQNSPVGMHSFTTFVTMLQVIEFYGFRS